MDALHVLEPTAALLTVSAALPGVGGFNTYTVLGLSTQHRNLKLSGKSITETRQLKQSLVLEEVLGDATCFVLLPLWQEDPSHWVWDLQTLISAARHIESFRGPPALNNKAIQGKPTASYKALRYFGGPYRCFREALLNSAC